MASQVWESFLDIVLMVIGAVITIAVTGIVEWYKQPKLKITIGDCIGVLIDGPEPKYSKALRVLAKNISPKIPCIPRSVALRCGATIWFHSIGSGELVHKEPMSGRWANSPQPILLVGEIEGGALPWTRGDKRKLTLRDPLIITDESYIDIHVGGEEFLDIAVRYYTDDECYGWSNKSYKCNGRLQDYRLDRGEYIIRILIKYSGKVCIAYFQLVNTDALDNFKITEVGYDRQEVLQKIKEMHKNTAL